MKRSRTLARPFIVGLAVLGGIVVYAYGFQVTHVSLEETRSPQRQKQLVRIMRAIARPDIIGYEKEEFDVEAPFMMPCPEGDFTPAEVDASGPYMVITPPCADAKAQIQVEGFNFEPNTKGPLNFIPPSEVSLQLGNVETDAEGHFLVTVKLPNRQPVAEAQHIRATTRRNVGLPHLTRTAYDTWDKIIETVFLALLATTIGTIIAIPISFLAARNLMKGVSSPLASIALSLIGWPIGILAGALVARWMGGLSQMLSRNLISYIAGLILGPLISWWLARWALPQMEEQPPALPTRVVRTIALVVACVTGVLSLYIVSGLVVTAGATLSGSLGMFGFLGAFVRDLGEILNMLILILVALASGATLGSLGQRLGLLLSQRLPTAMTGIASTLLSAAAGVLLAVLIGAGINWLYHINNPVLTLWWPAAIGAMGGVALASRVKKTEPVSIGIAVYYLARTVLNTLRAIEPLIMVIVFAVWVGIGPFAGVLALSLHTIAALAKLYSEQVESILPGPLEAVTATGANRLQTIIYAVIPQIVPPYIAFTMYRWDINVRMSTIIGFAGGGGIGFLLQQNINLLNYRAASAQMFAIAVVVAAMDYLSSKMRERVV